MKKMTRALFSIIAVVLVLGMSLPLVGPVAAQSPVEIQLAVVLDGSNSINSSEWNTQLNGLIAALDDEFCIPRDGSVQLTVIQFGWNDDDQEDAELVWGPQVVNGTTYSAAKTAVAGMVQMGGNTPLHEGIDLAVAQMGVVMV